MLAIETAPVSASVPADLIIPVRAEDRWKQVPQEIDSERAAVLVDPAAVGLDAEVEHLWVLGDQHTQYNYAAAIAIVRLGGQRGVLVAAIERFRPDPILSAVSHRIARRTIHVPEGMGRFRGDWAHKDSEGRIVEHVLSMDDVDDRVERILGPLDTSLDREGWKIRPEAVGLWYGHVRPEIEAALAP